MKDLQEATERICLLKGELTGVHALMISMLRALPAPTYRQAIDEFRKEAELARAAYSNAPNVSDKVLDGLDAYVLRVLTSLGQEDRFD